MAEEIEMTLSELIRFEANDFLLGPTIEDRIHAIEPDAGLRILKQAGCRHQDWDHIYELCRFCAATNQQLVEEQYS